MPIPPNYEILKNAKPLSKLFESFSIPNEIFNGNLSSASILDQVYYTNSRYEFGNNVLYMSIDIIVPSDLKITLAGLDYVSFSFGNEDYFACTINIAWSSNDLSILLNDLILALHFSDDLLWPIQFDNENKIPLKDSDHNFLLKNNNMDIENNPVLNEDEIQQNRNVSINSRGSIVINKDFNFDIKGFDSFSLKPCKIAGDIPIAFTFENIKLDLSKNKSIQEISELGLEDGFQGIYIEKLRVYFGGYLNFLPDLTTENFAIGTGGLTGKISATFDLQYNDSVKIFEGDAAGQIFGIPIGLKKFSLEIKKNEIISSDIQGQIVLPFFEKPIEVEMSIDLKGNISFSLKGINSSTLVELTKEDFLTMKVTSFNFNYTKDEEISFALGGSVKPEFGDVRWPEIQLNSLKIARLLSENKWDIQVDGGWINFEKPLDFEIGPFKGSITKIGFGSGESTNFIGFSGSLSLVTGIGIEAIFDELLIKYPSDSSVSNFFSKISLELKSATVGVHIPNALSLIGQIRMLEEGFGGSLDITIIPTEMRIMGGAEFGHANDNQGGFNYMQIIFAIELPAPGFPLGSTPLSLRGFSGKWANNMGPSMEPGWPWAIAPPKGILPLSKMIPERNSKLFAAGIKITSTDGTLVSINALLALLLPGPVIMIEGRGAILTKSDPPQDPPFYALVMFNGREHYISANFSYNGDIAKGVIKLNALTELFFDTQNSSNWWIKVGQKTPKNKRIQATMFKTINTQSYFEFFSGPHIQAGGYIGIEKKKSFKVGYAKLKAYIEGGVDLSWKPEHAAGWLELVADIAVKVCGFGLSLGASGSVRGKTPYPRYLNIEARYHYNFKTPWPAPNIKGSGKVKKTFKSGSRFDGEFEPLISEVVVESAVPGALVEKLETFSPSEHPASLKDVPIVTLDAQPTISFNYPVNDDAKNYSGDDLPIAGNPSHGRLLHEVGDDRYDFSIKYLKIERLDLEDDLQGYLDPVNPKWKNTFDPPNDSIADNPWKEIDLSFGVWLAGPNMTGKVGATNLRLWSRTPFTQFRQVEYATPMMIQAGYLSTGSVERPFATWAAMLNASMSSSGSSSGIVLSTTGNPSLSGNDIAWLNNNLNGNSEIDLTDVSEPVQQATESTGPPHLSALVEEGLSGYPLQHSESEFIRIGFMELELAENLVQVSLEDGIRIVATRSNASVVQPFDIIDIPFYIISDVERPFDKIEEIVRGIYFDGAIEISFPFPVSECELYLYPLKRETQLSDDPFSPLTDDTVRPLSEHHVPPQGNKENKISSTGYQIFNPSSKDPYSFLLYQYKIRGEPLKILVSRRKPLERGSTSVAGYSVENNVEEGLRVVDISSVDGKPFDSIKIINTEAMGKWGSFLVGIGYRIDITENYEKGKDKIVDFNTNAWGERTDIASTVGYDGGDTPDSSDSNDSDDSLSGTVGGTAILNEPEDDGILKPRCCYRMTVEYNAGKADNTIKQFYFRTDGPPADDIDYYIAWPIPTDDYPLFRSYSVGIQSKSNYLDKFYEWSPLELVLEGSNKTIRYFSASKLLWLQVQPHKLSVEEEAYIDAINNSEEVNSIDRDRIPMDLTLVATDTEPLDPDVTYVATLGLVSSDFKRVTVVATDASQFIPQAFPAMVTSTYDPTTPYDTNAVLKQQVEQSSQSFKLASPMQVNDVENQSFYRFTFRTSKFTSFNDMIQWTDLGENVKDLPKMASDTGRPLREDAIDACHQIWAPKKQNVWDTKTLVMQRLAKKEELLKIEDELSEVSKELDEKFDESVASLGHESQMISLDPLPKKTTVLKSNYGIILEFPHHIEFERLEISVKNNGSDRQILYGCSSSETRILIIPVSGEDFSGATSVEIKYMLNVGNHKPRYFKNGNTGNFEPAVISL